MTAPATTATTAPATEQLGLFSRKAPTDCPRLPGRGRVCADARARAEGCPGAKACSEWTGPRPSEPAQTAVVVAERLPEGGTVPFKMFSVPAALPLPAALLPVARELPLVARPAAAAEQTCWCGAPAGCVYTAGLEPAGLVGPLCKECADSILRSWRT